MWRPRSILCRELLKNPPQRNPCCDCCDSTARTLSLLEQLDTLPSNPLFGTTGSLFRRSQLRSAALMRPSLSPRDARRRTVEKPERNERRRLLEPPEPTLLLMLWRRREPWRKLVPSLTLLLPRPSSSSRPASCALLRAAASCRPSTSSIIRV